MIKYCIEIGRLQVDMTNTNTRVTENQNNELHNNLEECRYVDCSEFESSYNKFVGILHYI